jgi:class 3 adenylate cyclase
MAADPELEANIRVESNRALASGARYAMFLGLFSGAPVVLMGLRQPAFLSAAAFPVFVSLYSYVALRRARQLRMHSGFAIGMLGLFCLTPTAFMLMQSFVLPFGAATFFNGPINNSYFIVIALSGFLLDKQIARVAGVLAGVCYFAGYLIARQHLEQLPADLDAALREDLRSPLVHFIRSTLLVGEGFIVGGLSTTARRLLLKVRDEEREKASINTLFGQYVSPEVREKLVREKAGLVGERKVVAVLFSDLRGFTRFSENSAPAEVVARLNQYFDRMVWAITSRGGTVDKFIGDAVMAVFGGLIPLECSAEAALEAAFAMRAELRKLNETWAAKGLTTLENGIGIAYGEVLQGPIGSADRKSYTVIGDVVNTASRLESATKELTTPVLVSEALVAALPPSHRAALSPLGELKLKGKEQAVKVFGATLQG